MAKQSDPTGNSWMKCNIFCLYTDKNKLATLQNWKISVSSKKRGQLFLAELAYLREWEIITPDQISQLVDGKLFQVLIFCLFMRVALVKYSVVFFLCSSGSPAEDHLKADKPESNGGTNHEL